MYPVMSSCSSDRLGWRYVLGCLGRGLVLNQAIGLAVGLLLASANGGARWRMYLLAATVVSQSIGLLCEGAMIVGSSRLARFSLRTQRVVGVAVFCLCGVAGAEIAWRVLLAFGVDTGSSRLLRMEVGAVVAMLVGMSQQAMGDLRTSLDDTRRQLQERELREAHLVQAKTEAELAALRSRIDPHFLFNTLNSIAALIREDPDRAEAATVQLSSLFRYALQAHRQSVVELAEEVEIARRYLDIERLRLGDRLNVEIDVDPGLEHQEVPALFLQPLVENAVKHGIAPSVGGGTVRVRGWRDGTRTLLSVANTGHGAGDHAGTGEGLENVRRRLQAIYGERATVTLDTTGAWTETLVTLP
jgi:two-component system, LytTR family, sensor histidine kinase AlgZ